MSTERRKRIRDNRVRDRNNAVAAKVAGLEKMVEVSDASAAENTDRLVVLEAMGVEHAKCPFRIKALHRESLAKDEKILELKAALKSEQNASAHWRDQHLARGAELSTLQQEIGPLRNDAKSAKIATLQYKLHDTQQALTQARMTIEDLEA